MTRGATPSWLGFEGGQRPPVLKLVHLHPPTWTTHDAFLAKGMPFGYKALRQPENC